MIILVDFESAMIWCSTSDAILMGSAQNDDWRLNEGSVRNGGFLQRAGNLLLHNVGKQYIAKQKFDGL